MRNSDGRHRWNVSKALHVLAIIYTLALGGAAMPREAAAQSTCPRVEMTIVEPNPSAETRPVTLSNQIIHVRQNPITSTSDIAEIKVAGDDVDTQIRITYNPTAAAKLFAATTDRDGQRMAFVVNDDVLLAFTWQGSYGIGPDGTQLSLADYGRARAEMLIESIRPCIDGPHSDR